MHEFCMVERHGDDDVSYYYVDMKDEDRDAIDSILAKYETDGFSCRGPVDIVLDDLKELYIEKEH